MKLKEFFEGKNEKEKIERFSYLVVIVSAAMIMLGMLLGSTVQYTVLLATFGSFLTIVGIVLYVFSQFMKGE